MKKIRIGNDIVIKWRITVNGEEVNLEGLDLSLYISTTYQPRRAIAFTVAGNEITATYKGSEQRVTGVYRLTLYRNEGENSQSILDACDAFELVSCSCLTVDAAFGGAEVELPVADLGVGIPGLSAYEIAVAEGYEGTQEEWLASLSAASEAAAAECREVIAEFSHAEDSRVTAEAQRVANENNRIAGEGSRVEAENDRAAAEQLRATAESKRDTAELARVANENKRADAEGARSSAEGIRMENEKTRLADEETRVQSEAARVTAETKRANAEAQRETAEADRRAAEQVRIENENARKTAEQGRMNAEEARATAENLRKTAEDARIANEATRQTNEQARVTAETNRESAETDRADAEAARVEAENARAEEFAGFTATLAAKEDVANKVTSINAGADDVHYPSAKAVLNLAETSVYPFTKSLLLSEYDLVSTKRGNVWLDFPLLKGYVYKFKIQDDSADYAAIFGEKKNNIATSDYTIAYNQPAGTLIECIPSDNFNYIRIYSGSAGVKVKITSQCANITEHNRISDMENELPAIKAAVDSPLSNLAALETTNNVVGKRGFETASGYGSLKYDVSGCTGILYKSPLKNTNFVQCCITDTELKILWLSEHIADGDIDCIDLRNIANAKYLFLSVKLNDVSCWVKTLNIGNPLILNNRIEELSFEKIHYNIPFYEKNLFLNKNGTTSSTTDINFTTDFIPVDYEKFFSISANALFGNEYGGGIAFYDSEQNFIRSIYRLNDVYKQDTLYSFTKEELSKDYNINHFAYIRVCGKTESTYLNCVLLSNITSQINKNKNDIISINDCLSITKQSLSGSTLMTETNVFINSKGSEEANNNFVSSNFIPFNGVAYNIKITSNFFNQYGGGIVFYDKDKQFISSIYNIDTDNISTTHIFEKNDIPRNAAFIRTSCRNADVGVAFIEIRTCDITPNLENDDIRERVFIKNTDTQEDIVDKMFYAYNKKNCNVYFERGVYNFTTAFDYIHDNYNGQNHNELPIGGNNKYFFNGSTLIGTSVTGDEQVYNNESLLGSQRKSGSYELYDAVLIANDLTYVVHDEAGGVWGTEPYVRKYSNIKMRYHKIDKTSDIMKCIGGGTALYGNVIIENCLFECDNGIDVSYHGFSGDANGEFMLTISNCYFSVGLGLDFLAENQVATAQVSSCSFAQAVIDSQGRWTKYLFCNEIRE